MEQQINCVDFPSQPTTHCTESDRSDIHVSAASYASRDRRVFTGEINHTSLAKSTRFICSAIALARDAPTPIVRARLAAEGSAAAA